MKPIDILNQYWNPTEERFENHFIQAFVERNGQLNMREFIRYFEVSASYAEIKNALVEVNGSQKIAFSDFEPEFHDYRIMKERYSFGTYPHVRDLIMELGEEGIFVTRDVLFRYVERQRPERNKNSFLPTSMQDTSYERSTETRRKEQNQESAE
ncbi:hypothetical protein KAMAJI_00620 [Serratia phage vB_SmaM-Kamaji]|nr:hypothetical protein KAMAJI_00620 [Serratia phage vB_SmaM-Kamaji]